MGVEPERSAIKDAYQRATEQTTLAYAERHYYLHRDFFRDTLHGFAKQLGVNADAAVFEWYEEAHREAIVACLELKRDCRDTLEHLRDRGLYLSVVSNIDDDMLEPLIERCRQPCLRALEDAKMKPAERAW